MSVESKRALPLREVLFSNCEIGEPDASQEWGDPGRASRIFLHTDSYRRFCSPDVLYMFGRRGTGKTAIIRMLTFEVRHHLNESYAAAWVVDEENAYRQLALSLRMSPMAELPEDELKHVLNKKWEWIITVSAMCGVVWQAQHQELQGQDRAAIRLIRKYLVQQKLLDDGQDLRLLLRPVQVLNAMVEQHLKEVGEQYLKNLGPTVQTGLVVARFAASVAEKVLTEDYESARRALRAFLAEQTVPALVLVDSIDEYNLDDHVSRAVAASLIETCESFFRDRAPGRIVVKAAFPSEIYSHLRFPNAEKSLPRLIFVLWSFSDLVSLIAKRFAHYIKDREHLDQFESYRDARAYLGLFLPLTVKTREGIELDTLAYVLRHTQKKPRQAIALFNAILTLAKEKGLYASSLTEEVVVQGIERSLHVLTEGVFQVFERIFPHANKLVHGTLTGALSVFSQQTLDKHLKNVASIRGEQLSREEVKRLLFQSGVLGLVRHRRGVPRVPRVQFWEAVFEYQVPRILTAGPDATLAVHPMFYEQLETHIVPGVFIYPVAAEDAERDALVRCGVVMEA